MSIIEFGLVKGGVVLSNTEFVSRSSNAWYSDTDDDVFRRRHDPKLIVGHWTASARRPGVTAADRTFANMNARRRANGSDMKVSAQFVIADDGTVWQLADLKLGCFHASNTFSTSGIGIEYSFPGTAKLAKVFKETGPTETRSVAGKTLVCAVPSPAALAGFAKLANTLADLYHIPKVSHTSRTRFTTKQMLESVGVVEHFHAKGTTKLDAGGYFVDYMATQPGWVSK